MSDQKLTLNIILVGAPATGKSTLAREITALLEMLGFACVNQDPDAEYDSTSPQRREFLQKHHVDILASLREKVQVNVRVATPKKSGHTFVIIDENDSVLTGSELSIVEQSGNDTNQVDR